MSASSHNMDSILGDPQRNKRFVLIVDDDRDFAESLQDLLGAHQYTARIANSSEEALRMLIHYPASVVLLDIRLGMQSGIRLLSELRHIMPDIMCVMITAYSSADTAIEALRYGAYDYLAKPIRAEVLMATLDKCFERIRLKQERDSAQRKLASSESRYRQLIEDSSAVSWEYDVRNSTFLYIGRQIEKLTGIPLQSWLSESFFLRQMQADDLSIFKHAISSAIRNRRDEVEFRLGIKDGGLIWVRCIIDILDDTSTGIVHGYLFDITDQVNARVQQSRLQNQLQQAQRMEAIGYLTGGVAHDFNNILASIMGYTDLAIERLKKDAHETVEGYLQEIRNSGNKAKNLVGRMLAYSRGGTGDPIPVELVEMVNNSMRLVRASLPSTITLSLEGTSSHDKVLVDPVQLQQLLMNLCINARDATDGPGLITLQVVDVKPYVNECASCHRPVMGEYACLSVTDTGSGMSDDLLKRIFDPFFTTKHSGQGSGLGLSIIHGIVHEYGGHILIDSQPGSGTRFRILLPILQQLANTSEAEGDKVYKLILVEDDRDAARAYQRALEATGYAVSHYLNATDVLALDAEQLNSQIIIVDHSLPEISGIELIRRLRARGLNQLMLLYTRDANFLSDAAAIERQGVDLVIRRPELPSSLVNAVGGLFKSQNQPDQV